MRKSVFVTGAMALLGLAACGDQLAVENVNNPDVDRVLSTAVGIEAAIGGLGSQVNNPQRQSESVNTQAKLLAEESFASVANFGMAARVANRSLISNELGNDNANSNQNNYFSFQQVARSAANALTAYGRVVAASDTLSDVNENRMRAFAYLMIARSLANVAVAYDSGASVVEGMTTDEIPELVGAAELNLVAIAYFDSAETIAGRGMSALPNTWLSGNELTQAEFQQLVRSYRARARAAIARTPAERQAVDWPAVIADATNGITEDHEVQVGGTTGWTAAFDASNPGQIYTSGGWHTWPMMFAGMADVSGEYQNWVTTTPGSRRSFLVVTPDLRWPQGATRAAQQADTPTNNILPRYFRNRPSGEDVVAAGSGESMYDHRRYGATQANASGGPYTEMSATEIRMLAAEGHLRAGNTGAAEDLIDVSRTRATVGLPAVSGIGAGEVPGGASCVPRTPARSGNGAGIPAKAAGCGDLWDAMKYEKRMETAFTGYMIWFSDSRGWGDLPGNTAVEWPVPYQEMQARQKPFYNGTRVNGPANSSSYGF